MVSSRPPRAALELPGGASPYMASSRRRAPTASSILCLREGSSPLMCSTRSVLSTLARWPTPHCGKRKEAKGRDGAPWGRSG